MQNKNKMAAITELAKGSKLCATKKLLTSIRMCSFQALGVNDILVERLANLGIQRPSEIQEKVR